MWCENLEGLKNLNKYILMQRKKLKALGHIAQEYLEIAREGWKDTMIKIVLRLKCIWSVNNNYNNNTVLEICKRKC